LYPATDSENRDIAMQFFSVTMELDQPAMDRRMFEIDSTVKVIASIAALFI
jgi:hypothetical protein